MLAGLGARGQTWARLIHFMDMVWVSPAACPEDKRLFCSQSGWKGFYGALKASAGAGCSTQCNPV